MLLDHRVMEQKRELKLLGCWRRVSYLGFWRISFSERGGEQGLWGQEGSAEGGEEVVVSKPEQGLCPHRPCPRPEGGALCDLKALCQPPLTSKGCPIPQSQMDIPPLPLKGVLGSPGWHCCSLM